jgi:hypothetical protein
LRHREWKGLVFASELQDAVTEVAVKVANLLTQDGATPREVALETWLL